MKSLFEILIDTRGVEARMDFGLDRFRRALKHVGDPQTAVKTLVIGGTNGKGTVSLLVSAGLRQAGFRVGTYLSPHLCNLEERFLNGCKPEQTSRLYGVAAPLQEVAEMHNLTYFEYLTLVCFVWAKEQAFDFLVLEVGLGGRLDATNVTEPIACAITTIGLDHTQWLGETDALILKEKLGIVTPEGLLFSGVKKPELVQQIETYCAEVDAIPYFSKEINIRPLSVDWSGQEAMLGIHRVALTNPSIGALDNAALAFLLLRIVFPKYPLSTWLDAFRTVQTPGRMEVVAIEDGVRIVISGDHNCEGMQNLAVTLARLGNPKVHTVCGFSPDKPHAEMVSAVQKFSESVTLTQSKRHAGQSSYHSLGDFIADAETAVKVAKARCRPGDTLLITGSLYLVGELRPLWQKEVCFVGEGDEATLSPKPSRSDAPNRAPLPQAAPKQKDDLQSPDAAL